MRMMAVEADYVAADWARRGFSCDLWIDPPGQRWEGYVHEVDELLMLVEGALELECEGRTWHPAIGEEVYIPARVCHAVRNVGGTTARWLYGYRAGAQVAS